MQARGRPCDKQTIYFVERMTINFNRSVKKSLIVVAIRENFLLNSYKRSSAMYATLV